MEWKKEAKKWALNKFDIIRDEYITENFIEFHGKIGGDWLIYRYYSNGIITER